MILYIKGPLTTIMQAKIQTNITFHCQLGGCDMDGGVIYGHYFCMSISSGRIFRVGCITLMIILFFASHF